MIITTAAPDIVIGWNVRPMAFTDGFLPIDTGKRLLQVQVTRHLTPRALKAANPSRALIATRPLSPEEIRLAKKNHLKRYYLPELSQNQSESFFSAFDTFWDNVVGRFGSRHPFWRNVVSSKMQEWEGSLSYLALLLYTLAQQKIVPRETILIVCASLQESAVCQAWAKVHKWRLQNDTSGWMRMFGRRLFQETVNIIRLVYLTAVCLYYKILAGNYRSPADLQPASVLICSLLYSSNFKDGNYQDPFFGDLHRRKDTNANSVTYLCAPLDDTKNATRRLKTCADARIISPFALIRPSQIVQLMTALFIRRVRVDKAEFCGCDFSGLLAWNARRISYFNVHAEIYYVALRKLCAHENYDRLIIPYEGNVFERACMQAFRENSHKPVIGYSHAVVFPLNLKIRLSPGEINHRPEPDLLLCTGPENKTLLALVGRRDPNDIFAACSLRHIPVAARTQSRNRGKGNILVALDGVRGSAAVLDWLLENAVVFKNQRVVIRAHPNVPFQELRKQCIHPWPSNFISSRDDLATDLANAFCVIYRQTSVGMQALLNGIDAIHLNVDAPLTCDPLMNMAGIWRVSQAGAFPDVFQRILIPSEDRRQASREDAKAYVASFFSTPDPERVALFFT